MVKVEKDDFSKTIVCLLTFQGGDADEIFYLLKRIYTRMQGVKVDAFECIPEGTLIFEDEFAVLEKLFQ